MTAHDPETSEQWQEAVDIAAGARALADCKMYGLIEGGPSINVRRCDEILRRGAERNVLPSEPVHELALQLIASYHAEVERNAPVVATYEITGAEGNRRIRCTKCGLTSANPNDVSNLYCGHCHRFHARVNPAGPA